MGHLKARGILDVLVRAQASVACVWETLLVHGDAKTGTRQSTRALQPPPLPVWLSDTEGLGATAFLAGTFES